MTVTDSAIVKMHAHNVYISEVSPVSIRYASWVLEQITDSTMIGEDWDLFGFLFGIGQ